MADVVEQQVAVADDDTNMATEESQQQSKLLSIAPEIRNAIYELSVTGLKYAIRVDTPHPNHPAPWGSHRFHFGRRPPPLYRVCRSTYNEFPKSQYLASKTFVFTTDMFEPGVLDALISTCTERTQAMRRIDVEIVRYSTLGRALSQSAFDVRFTLRKLHTGEVKVEAIQTWPHESCFWDQDVCLCELLRQAERGTREDLGVVEVLRNFIELCGNGTYRPDLFPEYDVQDGGCSRCGTSELRAPRPQRSPPTEEGIVDEEDFE
ncbi:hypothetical protein LTR17_005093 [Elasticomyces elasticus]|nr:hypothetical protein LTR17_005093 [Elasticomyces elasticus]